MKKRIFSVLLIIVMLAIILCIIYSIHSNNGFLLNDLSYTFVGLALFLIYYIPMYYGVNKCLKYGTDRAKQICKVINGVSIFVFFIFSVAFGITVFSKIDLLYVYVEENFLFVLLSNIFIALKFYA